MVVLYVNVMLLLHNILLFRPVIYTYMYICIDLYSVAMHASTTIVLCEHYNYCIAQHFRGTYISWNGL